MLFANVWAFCINTHIHAATHIRQVNERQEDLNLKMHIFYVNIHHVVSLDLQLGGDHVSVVQMFRSCNTHSAFWCDRHICTGNSSNVWQNTLLPSHRVMHIYIAKDASAFPPCLYSMSMQDAAIDIFFLAHPFIMLISG